MYKFTIDRSEWLNGYNYVNCDNGEDISIGKFSSLYDPRIGNSGIGKKCCLGILLTPFLDSEYLCDTQKPSLAMDAYQKQIGVEAIEEYLLYDLSLIHISEPTRPY